MSIPPRGLLVFAAFAAVFMLAVDTRLGLLALVAWVAVEVLLWAGVGGAGRSGRP